MGCRSWSRKFADAFRGLRRAFRTQTSFAVHLAAAGLVVAAGVVLQVSPGEWGLLAAAIGGVLMAETFNTALESLARALDTGIHPRVRDALDMASAAVLLASLTAATIGLVVFVPRLGRLLWPLGSPG